MSGILIMLMACAAVSPDAAALFEKANSAYHAGDLQTAIDGYEALLTGYKIDSPALLYNLGNAWMESGKTGQAILCYESALQLDAGYDDARKGLQKALDATKRNLPPPDARTVDRRYLARYYPLSPRQSLGLTCAAWIAALLLLLAHHRWARPRLKWACIGLCLGGCLLHGVTIHINYSLDQAPVLAVTLAAEAPVYFSTAETESPRFVLYEGDRVLVDRVEGDWVRVNAHGGERGWTKRENAGLMRYGVL